jgi:hypothetical protein
MIDSLFTAITLIVAAGLAFHTYRLLADRPHRCATENIDLPAGIPVSDIGIIERDIVNLRTVMVVAHKVEPPTSTLAEAVDHNFKRKVKYTFLISNDNESEIHGYYQVFKAYAQVALREHPGMSLSDLIEILKLPYNWDDFPYIFYTVQLPSGEEKTLAYRGDQLQEGIADHYGRVDPVLAHTIANAIVSEAPKPLALDVEREQFDIASAKVIQFSKPPAATAVQ